MSVYCYKVCNNHYTNHVVLLWCSSSKRRNSNLGIVEPASATASCQRSPRPRWLFDDRLQKKRTNGSAAHRSRFFFGYPTISHVKDVTLQPCNPCAAKMEPASSAESSHMMILQMIFRKENCWKPWNFKLLEWMVLFLKLREVNGLFVQSWWNFVQAKILMICPGTCKVDWLKWLKRLVKDKVLARPCWSWLLAPISSEGGSCMTLYNMWIHVQSKKIGKRRCFAWKKLAKSLKWPYRWWNFPHDLIQIWSLWDCCFTYWPLRWYHTWNFLKAIVSKFHISSIYWRKAPKTRPKRNPGHIGRRFMVC